MTAPDWAKIVASRLNDPRVREVLAAHPRPAEPTAARGIMQWAHTRWDRPHDHEGEFSIHCEPCRSEWIESRAAEIIAAQGLHPVLGRAYTYTEAEELAAAELAEQYEEEPRWT